jgi:ubiquitin
VDLTMPSLFAFAAAVKAGDLWARATLIAGIGAAIIAAGAWQIYSIRQSAFAEVEAARARAAQARIIEMEKRNEEFRRLEARDRCLAFMRDSGLQEDGCN